MEFDDCIPLGILYQEEKATFHDKNKVLSTGIPLINQPLNPAVIQKYMLEFV